MDEIMCQRREDLEGLVLRARPGSEVLRSFGIGHDVGRAVHDEEGNLDLLHAVLDLPDRAEELPHLRKHEYQELLEGGRRVRAIEKEADSIYRQAISQLFSDSHPDFREMLRQKEALDDLEAAVDYCDNVADLLTNVAVKHG